MHSIEPVTTPADPLDRRPWWAGLTRYHWFVLMVAALGWLFDTFDQQLFNLGRKPAMTELLGVSPNDPLVDQYGAYATSIFIMGWAMGGLVFGILGDKIGRAKVMMMTILLYSIFTGLSSLSQGFWDFALWRFLTGLGVGGEFAVGVALVAEVMPDRARPHALGWLQALSAVGNIGAALTNIALGIAEGEGRLGFSAWRVMFVIGALPALLAILIRARLKEPERWQQSVADGSIKNAGSLRELFGDPRWRKNAIVGLLLAFAGVVGLWGIGFFSFDFVRTIFRQHYEAQGLPPEEIGGKLTRLVGYVSLLQNIGGFFGIYAFSRITHHIGRKPAFLIAFILAIFSTAGTFWFLNDFYDVFWMIPGMGFCQLMLFGGYAIYFPELFPTRLRSTGTSFCYNVGRFVAAIGPFTMGYLIKDVFTGTSTPNSEQLIHAWRLTGVTMCGFFLIGLIALPFAPETKGKPLPE
ncbi:MAG: MFS transporter [Planctomycetia bacterium]|nr:MFS transporter [Planctomycetia bacterium]